MKELYWIECNNRKCPKCGLNYITDSQRECSVCVSESKPYGGKYCENCGEKSGQYNLCRACDKAEGLSMHERRACGDGRPGSGYRTDNGMLGSRTNKVCRICGIPTYGQLCGRCYMATRDTAADC